MYQRLHIGISDFKFLKGQFRPGGSWLVWGDLAWSEEREAAEKSFEIGAILDSKGKIVEIVRDTPRLDILQKQRRGRGRMDSAVYDRS